MIHAGSDIGDDGRDFCAAVRRTLAGHENPHRLFELAHALRWRINLQFSFKCDFEKALLDFVIGEIGSLGSTPTADVGIFSNGGIATDHSKRYRDRGQGRKYRPAHAM